MPTAVIAFNDRCALGVLDVLSRRGVDVPQDVSIVGFDNSPLAGLAHIDLTTVGQDSGALARRAVGRLIERLDSITTDGAVVDLVQQPTLIIRGSTGPARHPTKGAVLQTC
jgi:DNA-binding LacI/PurR family transcriptional regulator